MFSSNPKLIISQYFDSLIRDVDIFTEENLKKFTDDQVIGPFKREINSPNQNIENENKYDPGEESSFQNITEMMSYYENARESYEKDYERNTTIFEEKLESIKVWEYFNEARDEILAELNRAQEKAFKRYETIKNEIKRDGSMCQDEWIECVKAGIFSQKFYFVFLPKQNRKYQLPLNVHLVVLDFYVNKRQREYLKKSLNNTRFQVSFGDELLIKNENGEEDLKHEVSKEFHKLDSLTLEHFLADLLSSYLVNLHDFSRHVNNLIEINKQNLCSIKKITCQGSSYENVRLDLSDPTFDFSNLRYFELNDSRPYLNLRDLNIYELNMPYSLKYLKIQKTGHNKSKYLLNLHSSIFFNLGHIRCILFGECDFSNVSSDAFKSLANLEALDITQPNNSSHIQLKHLTKLKWLIIQLTDPSMPIFEYINENVQVFELAHDLQNISISSINSSIKISMEKKFQGWNMPNLKSFRFYDRTSRIEFDLDWLIMNKIKEIHNLSLENLQLKGLFELKGNFRAFPNLKSLEMIGTCFIKLYPGIFNSLKHLKTLNLKFNPDSIVPGLFDGLVSLENLDLGYTSLTFINKEIFNGLDQLTSLDLSGNRLKLKKDTFKNLIQLKNLILNCCCLVSLKNELFSNLTRLEELDLSFNGICGIENEAFKGLENLRILKLMKTSLRNLDINMFLCMRNLTEAVLYEISDNLREKLEENFPKTTFYFNYD